MKEKILRIIKSYDFEKKEGRFIETKLWTDIYTYNLLKSTYLSKSKSAVEVHKLELQDEIMLMIQNGMSEKDSVVITENFISIAVSNLFSKNQLEKILWNDLDEIKFVNHSVIFMLKDGTTLDYDINKIFSKNTSKASSLIQMLQRILLSTSGQKDIITENRSFLNKNKIRIGIVLFILLIGGIVISQFYFDKPTKQEEYSKSNIETIADNVETKPVFDTIWSDVPNKDFELLVSYEPINVFYEPYEVTMQKQSRWSSGKLGDRIIIPIEIPEDTKYWIYRVNLSNARIESNEEKLVNDVSFKLKTVKIVGIDVYETTKIESSLVREFLNSLNTPDKTKPFTNIYFIDSKNEAEKFQKFQEFESDINNSIKKTHSRNGMIKFNKSQYVYLGLENEGYSEDIYVKLEVVALIEKKSYFKLQER